MLPLMRPFCSPSLYPRQCRTFTHDTGLSNVHHVRFKRPWIRRFATTWLFYGAALHLWSSLLFLQFDGESERDSFEDINATVKPSASNRHTEVRDNHMFIPMGWPRIRPGKLYGPSDSEWQEFVNISKDKQQLHSLRDELATIAWTRASQSAHVGRLLGGPLKPTGAWLVHRFPYRAPPYYEQLGLQILDAHVSWVLRPITPEQGDQTRKVMQPFAITSAVSEFLNVLCRKQFHRFQESLNIEGSRNTNKSIMAIAEMNLQPNSTSSIEKGQPSLSDIEVLSQNSFNENFPNQSSTRTHLSLVISILQRLPTPDFAPGSDLHQASIAFKKRLMECRSQYRPTPKRGVFYITGPVGLKGPRGYCRIEVCGEYDPATKSWTAVWMHLKDLNLYNQKPLGGHLGF